jgi:hypothetical protein
MADLEAQRYMLFISEGYRLLAERAESRETVAQEAYEQQPRSLWIGGHGTDP